MFDASEFKSVVFAGGGSRCMWQAGFWEVAAPELGIKPENCVVFEDAQAGIEAAIRAGMKTVGVGSPEILSEADVVIPNLKEAGIAIFSKLI